MCFSPSGSGLLDNLFCDLQTMVMPWTITFPDLDESKFDERVFHTKLHHVGLAGARNLLQTSEA